ncbi:pentatricopeptide repeat-containing protein At3g49170, chloroplastic [Rutidosis leptorrhynchoides]|uniref:pentatricopeptide repeat-containing protein At3g49170, chloroplastic n=1 Tax=Rutidosis leptorrhynchoides TaxID=125765 RepID=UPI003A99DDBF
MSILCLLPPAKLTPNSYKSTKPPSNKSVKPLKNPTFEPLKDRLISLSNVGQIHEAIKVLDVMTQQHQLTPDLTTFSVLLKSCIRTRNFELGRLVHSKLNQSGIKLDSIVLNSLISLYSKCGDWATAKTIFDSMGDDNNRLRDLVSWSAMISCFAHNRMESQALLTFVEMLRHGEFPNQFCFSAAIQACCNRDYAWFGEAIFGFVIKTGYIDSDVCVGCALVDLFAKGFHDLESAQKVFDKMPERNSVTWTLLITRYAQFGYHEDGIELFLSMLFAGFTPDRFTLSSVLSACAELGFVSVGQQLHSWVVKLGLCLDVYIGCSLVDMYAKCMTAQPMEDARKVFERMASHNVMSWTAIITGYVQSGGLDETAIELYCKMITQGDVLPNHFTYSSLFKACGSLSNLEIGKQIHNHAVKSGQVSVNCVGNSLISMYARSGSMEDAQKAFDVLLEKNLISYNAIVDGYVRNTSSDEAFKMFNRAEETQTGVDSFTFASLLSAAASLGAVGKGEEMHARLMKSGFSSNLRVCNALISMYSRCGDIEAAARVFNKMVERNVISWTSIITGYAKHGLATRALEKFDQMLEAGVKPNEVTYIAVLSACSHVGMIEEGLQHLNSMYQEHKLTPKMEHYACVVDLLGRSGSLEKAMDFINSMPFKADALVWRTLLGACQVHGNTELGKLCAKMITEQDVDDPSAYILLSNLYASKGEWEKVAEIRKTMKERNLIKEAGCSWIEADNQTHKFYVGDTCHPRAHEIYKELDQLVTDIKKLGYVPDTSFVLHEVDEKEKEGYLVQHSEKIAVAFGLISMSKMKPIRVFKNLRVCGDCHTAMKYISMAREKEIVVRDSNRFHHFKNGSCSCNDYW